MTTNLHLNTALRHRDETFTWMMSPQAAVMAQIDEQQRGKQAGLQPGSNDAKSLQSWIDNTYGKLPAATGLDSWSPAVQQAGRVRQWQAQRLKNSTIMIVDNAVQAVISRLASSGSFLDTPQLPDYIDNCPTLVWPPPYTGRGSVQVVGPGALFGENNVCAITIDQHNHRLIEWLPTDQLSFGANIKHLLKQPNTVLPPWLIAADFPYSPSASEVTRLRAQIIAAASTPPLVDVDVSLLEQVNAALTAAITGLVSLKKIENGFLLSPP